MAERFMPVARTEDLIVQEMGPETLVFDRRTDVAHNLSPVASAVWNLCDGKHDVAAMVATVAAIAQGDAEAMVAAALTSLAEQDLLADGVSRRDAVKKMSKLGLGALATPLVVSVVAPAAAMAVSPGTNPQGSACTQDNQCAGTLVCKRPNGTAANGAAGRCATTTCVATGNGSDNKPGGLNCTSALALGSPGCCSGVCSGNFCG